MRIFNQIENFEDKVNFVDENNVFLGYDLAQDCCETAGWFISKKIEHEIQETPSAHLINLKGYVFDTSFFEMNGDAIEDCLVFAIFKITNKQKTKEKFIHLYNCHEGYYGHGFKFKIGEKIIKEEIL